MQRLHGMGEELYSQVVGDDKLGVACRVYAPVGSHEDLLPYLVRRTARERRQHVFREPHRRRARAGGRDRRRSGRGRRRAAEHSTSTHSPAFALYADRPNSHGINLHDPSAALELAAEMERALAQTWRAEPVVGGKALPGRELPVRDPSDRRRVVGVAMEPMPPPSTQALTSAVRGQVAWDRGGVERRAEILERAADLFEKRRRADRAARARSRQDGP
jgi:RHH-type proline utilization regulon transcriptional repressor/proline dehydrogenase/delta 1-pyrroline-5-carboxylate dehydrogenase